ncbi:MAG: TetR/AcrR family transcriptional regulator [Thermoleophilia bacterium]|nr:TetR/AcrR family transcriptional regulator [Thermoleophilia bacterium]
MTGSVNADAKRREIVTEAAVLFDRDGYHAVGVGQIAEAVGIRKPTLYHYLSSKDELLTWIHEEFIDLLLEKQAARGADGSAADEIRAVLNDVLELMETHRGHVRVFFEHHRELPDIARARVREKRDAYQSGVEQTIIRGVATGEFRGLDPRLATLALFGMCNWSYQWYSSDGPSSAAEIAAFFSEIFVEGIAVRPGY